MNKLPKTIYVFLDSAGTKDECLVAENEIDKHAEIGVSKLVGEYVLKRQVEIIGKAEIQCEVG